jgi:hypothetical protein
MYVTTRSWWTFKIWVWLVVACFVQGILHTPRTSSKSFRLKQEWFEFAARVFRKFIGRNFSGIGWSAVRHMYRPASFFRTLSRPCILSHICTQCSLQIHSLGSRMQYLSEFSCYLYQPWRVKSESPLSQSIWRGAGYVDSDYAYCRR